MSVTLTDIQGAWRALSKIQEAERAAIQRMRAEPYGSQRRVLASTELAKIDADYDVAYRRYIDLIRRADSDVTEQWYENQQLEPRMKPKFDPPVTAENVETVFLGGCEYAGTYFDLWYVLGKSPRSVAVVHAVHSASSPGVRLYERLVCERAGYHRKHAVVPGIPGWRDGANLALDDGDRRIKARRLPLSYR